MATIARDGWRSRLAEFMLVGGATLVLFPLAWIAPRRRRARRVGARGRLPDVLRRVRHQRSALRRHVPPLLQGRPEARVRHRASRRAARSLPRRGRRGARALAAWAILALALHSAQALGWMIQLMFLLVGWHYVKQGFGVLTVLSARRGVRLSAARARRRSCCIASPAGPSRGRARPRRPASSRRRASSTGRSRIRAGSSWRPARRSR